MSLALLTDLATVKKWLNIPTATTTDDAQLTQLISAISAEVALYCNRNFGSNSYTETYNGNGSLRQWLNQRPCTAVSSLTINGIAIPVRPDTVSCGYVFDRNEIYLYGWEFCLGFQNVVVTYTAGFAVSAAATPDLWQATTEFVAHIYQGQKRIGKKSDVVAGQNTSWIWNDLPESITLVLNRYEQVSPVQSLGNL